MLNGKLETEDYQRIQSRHLKREGIKRFSLTVPVLVFLIVFMGYPIVYSFFTSLMKYDGINPAEWVGLQNYIEAFTSEEFFTVFGNNIYMLLLGIPLATFVPLFIAIILFDGVWLGKFFKVVFLLPSVVSVVVVGILFRMFFSYNGPINALFDVIGLDGFRIDWLATGTTSIPIIVLAMVWSGFGVNMLIFLAGMSTIPADIYESAKLDGVGWIRRVFCITIPMIWDVLEFVVVMNIVTLFSSMFSFIYTMTDGGPGYESSVLEYMLYVKGMRLNDIGFACCIAVILFVMVFLLSRLTRYIFRRKDVRK